MPYTEKQKVAARIALAAKKGKVSPKKLKGGSASMYKSMTKAQLEDFATSKIKNSMLRK